MTCTDAFCEQAQWRGSILCESTFLLALILAAMSFSTTSTEAPLLTARWRGRRPSASATLVVSASDWSSMRMTSGDAFSRQARWMGRSPPESLQLAASGYASRSALTRLAGASFSQAWCRGSSCHLTDPSEFSLTIQVSASSTSARAHSAAFPHFFLFRSAKSRVGSSAGAVSLSSSSSSALSRLASSSLSASTGSSPGRCWAGFLSSLTPKFSRALPKSPAKLAKFIASVEIDFYLCFVRGCGDGIQRPRRGATDRQVAKGREIVELEME